MEITSLIGFIGGAVIAMILSSQTVSKAMRLQQDILARGRPAEGRIVRVWRPPLLGSFTRVYFEFAPSDEHGPLRCCHVDRRVGEWAASLPPVGATVNVRYLPENPTSAVIAKLVSRFTH